MSADLDVLKSAVTASYDGVTDEELSPPVFPSSWGRGRMVLDPEARSWRFVPEPPLPTVIGEPARISEGPVYVRIMGWSQSGREARHLPHCSLRLRAVRPGTSPLSEEGVIGHIRLRIAGVPVTHWPETGDRHFGGEMALDREQARAVRDTLTAFIEAGSD